METTETAGAGELIEVRASINLAGLHRGSVAWIDPTVPEDAALIAKGRLHPTGRRTTRAELERSGNDAV